MSINKYFVKLLATSSSKITDGDRQVNKLLNMPIVVNDLCKLLLVQLYVCDNPGCRKHAYLSPCAPYKHCSNCNGVYYCSAECQSLHWNDHKVKCKTEDFQRMAALMKNFTDDAKTNNLTDFISSLNNAMGNVDRDSGTIGLISRITVSDLENNNVYNKIYTSITPVPNFTVQLSHDIPHFDNVRHCFIYVNLDGIMIRPFVLIVFMM